MASHDELLDAYMAHAEAVAHDHEDTQHFWAFGELDELVSEDPESAWRLVREIVERATDDATLGYVAAGPLEDLICRHPESMIERVEQCAADNPRFRRAVKGVWGWSRMPEAIRKRLDMVVADEPEW